jgi:hypothetical protein
MISPCHTVAFLDIDLFLYKTDFFMPKKVQSL